MIEPQTFLDGRVVLHGGDCRDVIKTIPDASVDAIVTDPPYALVSIVKRFGKEGAAPAKSGSVYGRASAGFMGKQWDTGEAAFAVEFWAECYRVLKHGGHVAAFAGTRTYHRLACAIEDAGFEIRDQLAWAYGSGFPKSHNVGAQLPEWQGFGTALKPAWEPICLARKPLIGTVAENVLAHGTGALNIDGCRIGLTDGDDKRLGGQGEWTTTKPQDGYTVTLPRGVVSSSALGRFPANLVHDGSDEVITAFPDAPGQQRATGPEFDRNANVYGKFAGVSEHLPRNDSGSAARFFYSAKADANDRAGSKHPTVKPVDLMQWLCRLITPPGGLILDPFAGTGTTGEAAWREKFRCILIEREAEYQADIANRMRLATAGPDERKREITKRKGKTENAGPLFAGDAA